MYQLKRPHPTSDLTVGFTCGCNVRWRGSTDAELAFLTARQESCELHNSADRSADRVLIYQLAETRKRMLLALGW